MERDTNSGSGQHELAQRSASELSGILGETAITEVARMVGRNRMAHEIVQQVIGEMEFRGAARHDAVWWKLNQIHEENGLPYGMDTDGLFNLYVTNYGGSYE